jgi:S1-C subfamily serine protease
MRPSPFRFRNLLLLLVLLTGVPALPAWAQGEPADFTATLKAAEQGDAKAQVNLGLMYDKGEVVPQDYQQAVLWYTKGAVQGNADAQANLGVMYKEGVGVPQDYQQALAWYTKAAEQGHAKAQVNLAVMYFEGQGVPQNFGLAYVWSSLAAATGDEKGIINRDLLAAKLTPQGLAEAQAQSARIQEKINHPQTQADLSAVTSAGQASAISPTSSSSGSGFIITPEGYILTCAHVVENARAIKAKLGERLLDATVVRRDTDSDLALLKVTTGQPLLALAFAPARSATLGQDVFTIGFPNPQLQGVANKFTKGSVSSMAGAQDDPRFYQISVQVQPGNSGGPLLDFNGNVVGVVKAQIRGDVALETTGSLPQNINYAVKSTYALSLIDSLPEVAIRLPVPDSSLRPFADVVSSAERAVVQLLVYK